MIKADLELGGALHNYNWLNKLGNVSVLSLLT